MRFDNARALRDLRRMLRDILSDQLRQRRYERCAERTESWYACVGLARECIAGLRLLARVEWLEAMLRARIASLESLDRENCTVIAERADTIARQSTRIVELEREVEQAKRDAVYATEMWVEEGSEIGLETLKRVMRYTHELAPESAKQLHARLGFTPVDGGRQERSRDDGADNVD